MWHSRHGITWPELSKSIDVMNRLQRHRGPDGEGIWVHRAGWVAFGHVRLSIIDLSTGGQPMQGRDGNWISFNGEIYNYIELREELGEKSFQTTSDTEVILRSYEKWGEYCIHKLRGMFAFAIWDERNRSLFCARDRFGIKPLYFSLLTRINRKFEYRNPKSENIVPLLSAISLIRD